MSTYYMSGPLYKSPPIIKLIFKILLSLFYKSGNWSSETLGKLPQIYTIIKC